jgi:hypothetical protein
VGLPWHETIRLLKVGTYRYQNRACLSSQPANGYLANLKELAAVNNNLSNQTLILKERANDHAMIFTFIL